MALDPEMVLVGIVDAGFSPTLDRTGTGTTVFDMKIMRGLPIP
jgi:hypothetical protein